MTLEEEIIYTLTDCADMSTLSDAEFERIEKNKSEINKNYFNMRGKMTFGQAYKESALNTIREIIKAAPEIQHTTKAMVAQPVSQASTQTASTRLHHS